uniref:Clarin 1 n=1 Tax=Malurus cyaneus samueli TaxID=2593467 RepID=A0A8C5U6F7_9PASS
MPAPQKKLLSAGRVLSWPSGCGAPFLCSTGALLVNASGPELRHFLGHIHYGLFSGHRLRQCGLGARPFFSRFAQDHPRQYPRRVILFCTILIIFALVAAGFFMFNAFGSPYETLHGPVGLYLWSFIACSCGCLIMILFSSEVKIHHLSEKIANFKEGSFTFKTQGEHFADCFWTILVCSLVHLLNALLIRFAGFEFPFSKAKDSGTITAAVDLMY